MGCGCNEKTNLTALGKRKINRRARKRKLVKLEAKEFYTNRKIYL